MNDYSVVKLLIVTGSNYVLSPYMHVASTNSYSLASTMLPFHNRTKKQTKQALYYIIAIKGIILMTKKSIFKDFIKKKTPVLEKVWKQQIHTHKHTLY